MIAGEEGSFIFWDNILCDPIVFFILYKMKSDR